MLERRRSAAAGPSVRGPLRVGVSYQALRFPFVAALQRAAQARAAALGVELVEADAGNDVSAELANVENLLQQQIDCLAFEATSLDGSVASIEAANRAGVPVVQFNGRAQGRQSLAFVGSEQRESGDLLGAWLAEQLRRSGKPALRGLYLRGVAGQVTDLARSEALRARLAREGVADRIELIEQYADYDRGRGQSVTESLLAAHPDRRLHRREQRRHDPRRARGGRGARRSPGASAGRRRRAARDARAHRRGPHRRDRLPGPRGAGSGRGAGLRGPPRWQAAAPADPDPVRAVQAGNVSSFAERARRVYATR